MKRRLFCLSKTKPLALVLAPAFFVGGVLVSRPARADEAADVAMARTLGVEGFVLAEGGNCKEAIGKLEKAEKLHHAPTTATRLGECEIDRGLLVAGTERLQRVVHEPLPPNAHPAFVAAVARARATLDATLPRLASIRTQVSGACASPMLTVDGESVSEAAIGAERHIDPGAHRLRVTATGCYPFESSLHLAEGQSKVVEVVLRADPSAAPRGGLFPASLEERGDDSGRRTMVAPALVAFGLGAIGAGVGIAGGVVVASSTASLDQSCQNKVCPPAASADLDRAKTWATVSTVGFVAAGALAATGLTLLLISPKTDGKQTMRAQATFGLGSAGLSGQF